jgi:16S rRNA (guanine527-N7)-methyltransferase
LLLESVGAPVDRCLEQLERYRVLLQAEAARTNITKYRKPDEIVLYHFVDSLQALRCAGIARDGEVIDVGTGAGLPGVPCAIARPGWRITLLDSRQRRGRLLEKVAWELLYGRARVVLGRAETSAHSASERGRYDLVLARAVAPLPILLEITLAFLKPGGLLVTHRGAAWREDLAMSGVALDALWGQFVEALPYRLRAREAEHAVLVVRLSSLPDPRYPRSPSRIRRKPLL